MASVPDGPRVVRGELVYLRAAERSDLPDFVRWFNDADVLTHLSMLAPMSLAAEEGWFERMLATQGTTDYHLVVCLLADGRAIGTVGLHGIDYVHGTADFGIALGEKAEWGKGYGTDALRAICDFGFGQLRLERIGLHVYADNARGRRSYEKAGFVHEGTLRRAHFARHASRRPHHGSAPRGMGVVASPAGLGTRLVRSPRVRAASRPGHRLVVGHRRGPRVRSRGLRHSGQARRGLALPPL